jgi:hypothetical protein
MTDKKAFYVYLDESTFGESSEYSGYACFITKERITTDVIEEALINLEQDSNRHEERFKKQDKRTLARRYFHASDDSKNAHHHLCDSINKNVKGEFHSHFFNIQKNAFKNCSEAYDLASRLSILNVFSKTSEVVFIFEKRNGISASYLRSWWDSLWRDIFMAAFTHPHIKTYYPDFKFEIKSKSEPGLQVVDFLFWASSRQVSSKRCPWLKRIKAWSRNEFKSENETFGGHSLKLGILGFTENEKSYYDISDYRHNDQYLNSVEYLIYYIVSTQKVINAVAKNGNVDGVNHFWDEIEFLEANKTVISNESHIEKMAICFLKLFDNISLINSHTSPDDKAFLLHCRKCLAYALHTHNISAMLHSIRLSEIRNEIIRKYPSLLS